MSSSQKNCPESTQEWAEKRKFYLKHRSLDRFLLEGVALGYIAPDEFPDETWEAQFLMEEDNKSRRTREICEIEARVDSQSKVLFKDPNKKINLTFARKVVALGNKLCRDVDDKLPYKELLDALGFRTLGSKEYTRTEASEVISSFIDHLRFEYPQVYQKIYS
jgi:hypothetical protein